MITNQLAKILNISRYNFTDPKTNNLVAGTKINYLEVDPKTNQIVKANNDPNFRGVQVRTISGDFRLFDTFGDLSSLYSLEIEIDQRGSKPKLILISASPLPNSEE